MRLNTRLIDANAIRIKPEFMENICGIAMIRVEDLARILNEQPTIEQPQVVHCRDCKWWRDFHCENDNVSRKIQDCGCYPDFNTEGDWFCADGENRN